MLLNLGREARSYRLDAVGDTRVLISTAANRRGELPILEVRLRGNEGVLLQRFAAAGSVPPPAG